MKFNYQIKTKVPFSTRLKRSTTSLFLILIQPCELGIPIDFSLLVP